MISTRNALIMVVGVAVLGLALLTCGKAKAAQCLPAENALQQAHDKFGEVPSFTANVSEGSPVLLTLAPGGSWTLWVRMPSDAGTLCLVATGDGWSALPPPTDDPTPVPQMWKFPDGQGGYRHLGYAAR